MQYSNWREVPAKEWRWKNFSPQEIACKGTGAVIINETALDMLQNARELFNKPFVINSAYRSITHNASIGGSINSRHKNGSAFDISIVGLTSEEVVKLYTALKEAGFTGFGFYNSFIHVDTGRARSWGKRPNG